MVVADILDIIPHGTVVHVFQMPIERFDPCGEPVLRQTGEVAVLLASQQNYLEFEAVKLEQRGGIMSITCKASPAQERATIEAFYSGR